MKKRKICINKANLTTDTQNKNVLQDPTVIIILIVLFIIAYLIASLFLSKPLTDNRFAFYKQIARDVHEHGKQAIPDGVYVEMASNSITVSALQGSGYVGEVIAKITDGELVFIRHSGILEAIFTNIFFSASFVGTFVFAYLLNDVSYKKSENNP